jgi:hypothetical protein
MPSREYPESLALENDKWVIVALDSAYYSPERNLYMNGQMFNDGLAAEAAKHEAKKRGDFSRELLLIGREA